MLAHSDECIQLTQVMPCLPRVQIGLNGVDNGAIRFTHVRVPRGNLLDRFASVDKSGRYSSPLTSQARRYSKRTRLHTCVTAASDMGFKTLNFTKLFNTDLHQC